MSVHFCSQFVKDFKKGVDFLFYIWYKYIVLFVRVGILRPAGMFVNDLFTNSLTNFPRAVACALTEGMFYVPKS